jgi:DNA-binding LytR/AlgR family response regulator
MNIKVIAVDDEPLALQQIVTYISKVPYLELVAQCESAAEAIGVLNEEAVDAIFCDINMPDLNGMDFVKQLVRPPLIVFTTAYAEYAVEGFRVNAVDYLLKPFGLQEFLRAAERLKTRIEKDGDTATVRQTPQPLPAASDEESLFVKTDYRTVRINIQDIRYVEGMSEYLKLHLQGEAKPIITLLSMKVLEERLPQNFMRIHRSYIVNLDKIQEVTKNRVILARNSTEGREREEEVYLPVGDSYKEQFSRYIESRFLGK